MENTDLIDSLQYRKHVELEPYFNTDLFNSIIISNQNPKQIMIEAGYLSNVITRFWRLLQTEKLLNSKKGDSDYCDFLLETFLNQASSCSDNLATCLNYFLNLNLSGSKLALHNEQYINRLKESITGFPDIVEIDFYHNWVKEKLYPYRNIVHHMGEASGYVEMSADYRSIVCCLTLKEEEWNFVEMRQNLKAFPSHTAWQIATNNFPNTVDGSAEQANKYIRIDTFFKNWIEKVYNLIKKFVEAMVWFQTTTAANKC